MDRLELIPHKGKTVVYVDFSDLNMFAQDKFEEVITEAKKLIAQQSPGSALVLTNVNGLHFNRDIIGMLKEYTAHNKPYIKASALVGVEGLLKIGSSSIEKATMRELHPFETEADALNWLVEQ